MCAALYDAVSKGTEKTKKKGQRFKVRRKATAETNLLSENSRPSGGRRR